MLRDKVLEGNLQNLEVDPSHMSEDMGRVKKVWKWDYARGLGHILFPRFTEVGPGRSDVRSAWRLLIVWLVGSVESGYL